jgi:hypothetical protein
MASEVDPTHSDCDPDSDTYRDGHRHPHGLGHCYLNADVGGYRIRQTARQRKAVGVSYKETSNPRHREESGNSEAYHQISNLDPSRDHNTEGIRNYSADVFD